jgi:HAMP domain-containing protein
MVVAFLATHVLDFIGLCYLIHLAWMASRWVQRKRQSLAETKKRVSDKLQHPFA